MIGFDEFAKLDLRVGKVLKAEKVQGSDKLILLTIDIGERREIVAGIAEWYEPEKLVGKNVIVLANLAPKRIRGIESDGMLLAADDGKDVALLTIDKDLQPGTKVR